MRDSPSPADEPVAKVKARKMDEYVEEEESSSRMADKNISSNDQSSSGKKSSSTRQSEVSIGERSRDEAARERNRLAQKRFRARQKEKLEKQKKEMSEKEQERLNLVSEQKDVVATLRANAQLLSVRESLFSFYSADKSPQEAAPPEVQGASTELPTSLGANMASLVLQSGQNHLASAMTGQIEGAEYSAQFVSDPEERKCLALLSSADEVQNEFQRRFNAVNQMLQAAQGENSVDALSRLKEDQKFLEAQQKLFAFLWGMFCVNPSLALVWFAENSAIDPLKYAQTAKMLYAKASPDTIERLRKLHSNHTLEYEKRQAKLELVMNKLQKTLRDCPSASEYSAQSSASMFVTLQECTDAICEVAKEEFTSMVPFGTAFLSEFDLLDLSVMTCHMFPRIMDSYAMVTAVLREAFHHTSQQK